MTSIEFKGKSHALESGESVLEGLLRHGHDIPFGCKAGACHACMMTVESGTVPDAAQNGLKPTERKLGSFLSCSCIPSENLSVCLADEEQTTSAARVASVDHLSEYILRVRMEAPFDFCGGQYLNIWHSGGNRSDGASHIIRSYSIASIPSDNFIELQLKVIPDGLFSAWANAELKAGDSLMVQGPMGQCIYTDDDPAKALLLVGIGSGLAPLYGIIKDALHHGHKGDIHLVLGGRSAESFYLMAELQSLAEHHEQLSVSFVVQSLEGANAESDGLIDGDLYQYIKQAFPDLSHHRVYLCGAGSFVTKMKKQCFLSGASMREIHTDSFLPCS